MSKDFEEVERRKGGQYRYDPSKGNAPDPMLGRKGEKFSPYYGVAAPPIVVEEIKAWAAVLQAVTNGIPKPYDNSIIIDKIIKLEGRTGEDLSYLKKCCPPAADIREAKELKPFIFGVLDRLIDIGGLENYVAKYEQEGKSF